MKGLYDRTARLTERQEKNFKILNWIVVGLCTIAPLSLHIVIAIIKGKIARASSKMIPLSDNAIQNYQIMFWIFGSICVILNLMYAFYLLAAVFIIRRSLQKESMAHKIDLKKIWLNAMAFILAAAGPSIFSVFYYFLWSRKFYLDS